MSYATKEQLESLMVDISSRINIPTIGVGGGYAPIGTIIAYMGTTAPQDYLICDGTTYNIADYSQLANFIEAQFGSKDYFGGDGVTTFAVPDLRGEFLRGTGTNSHTNQGSGATVGTHQDGTKHHEATLNYATDTNKYWFVLGFDANNPDGTATNREFHYSTQKDYSIDGPSDAYVQLSGTENSGFTNHYTSRPTNTSVLYCIKAFVGGEDIYSTEERVVGHWLDGKPIYRKTVIIPVAKGATVNYDIRAEQTDLDIFIGYEVHGIVYTSYGKNYINVDSSLNSGNTGIKYTDNGRGINNNTSGVDNARKLSFVNNYNSSPGDADIYLTLKYTKTTD